MHRVLALFLVLAGPASALDAGRPYTLPGDPDTMVRRGPEVAPEPTPMRAPPANPVDLAAERGAAVPPQTSHQGITREVFVPWPYVVHPRSDWRLRLGYEDGQWGGSLVIGQGGLFPGYPHPHPAPAPEPRGLTPWLP